MGGLNAPKLISLSTITELAEKSICIFVWREQKSNKLRQPLSHMF